jgi:hypothetical protein
VLLGDGAVREVVVSFLLFAFAGICIADDAAWRTRLDGELSKAEAAAAKLDSKAAPKGELVDRIRALHERTLQMEKTCNLVPGTITGKSGLPDLTKDIVGLASRLRTVYLERNPQEKPPPPAPKPAPAKPAEKPQDPKEVSWPDSLSFNATANMVYQETGDWFIDSMRRSGLGNDFLMDGYTGTLSFSVRAVGLIREIRSADIRVGVKLGSPFTSKSNLYAWYEIRWNAHTSLWNGALKTWPKYDTIHVDGPIRWIEGPNELKVNWEAVAHVRSVTTKDGKTIQFDVPEVAPADK